MNYLGKRGKGKPIVEERDDAAALAVVFIILVGIRSKIRVVLFI